MGALVTMMLLLLVSCFGNLAQAANQDNHAVKYRGWVEQFKQETRGPFESVRWFCNDGTILPPKKYACSIHGGGRQYGVWNKRAKTMRENGYLVANLFSAIAPETFTGPNAKLDDFRQILIERFLIQADDGWVFRRARYYRGAIQIEAEQSAAGKIILAMLADPAWQKSGRYLLLREAARLLPITSEVQLGEKVRRAATDIDERDKGFHDLRVKIHSLPDAGDAARVRSYARSQGISELKPNYETLANDLDSLFISKSTNEQLEQLAAESWNKKFRKEMTNTIHALEHAESAAHAIAVASKKAQVYRRLLLNKNSYTVHNRLRFLRATLILEQEVFARANQLLSQKSGASRKARLGWLRHLSMALHATGLISDRQWKTVVVELDRLSRGKRLSVAKYRAGLAYLARIPQWSQRSLEFHFSDTVKLWLPIAAKVDGFVPDRLRGSPLLPFTRVLDSLVADANRLSGMSHHLFGREVASGLRALNPGLRRGVLMLSPEEGEEMHSNGIYILKSTTQKLTPVAGIITRGEGSSVSHVQLLARNMGIPNLVADDSLLKEISKHAGEHIVMAVSQRGIISIEADAPKWDAIFGREALVDPAVAITADLDKLNLKDKRLLSLHEIRAGDSGRTVGPKAANLGELAHYYPDMVTAGLVIPFAVFRQYLDQSFDGGRTTTFNWMRAEYARLASIANTLQRRQATKKFLAQLRARIISGEPGKAFRQQLRDAMIKKFESIDGNGLFVRSDTNVEDLPGFNGAGLNLTVANVVGFDAILHAIKRVWASPFSERAFAWRQYHMETPEHVYPAVLLMQSVASEKSGVMVTADVGNGDRGWLSIATNEGVGGAVEGQAAEELRVERKRGRVLLLAQATAPTKLVLAEGGGVVVQPASGADRLLSANEIKQLLILAADVERRFPLPRSSINQPVAADIEFAFSRNHLALFQIRPFVESKRAWHSQTLQAMDRRLPERQSVKVDLHKQPVSSGRLH